MFLRQTRRRKDGKTHVYWNIVENRRLDDGRVVQRQVLYLGEIHSSQAAAWRQAIEVFDTASGEPRTLALFPEDRCAAVADDASGVRLCLSAPARTGRGNGGRAGWRVSCGASCSWTGSGPTACRRAERGRAGTRFSRVLVAYRLIAPGSEWKLHRDWFGNSAMADLWAPILAWPRRINCTPAMTDCSSTRRRCSRTWSDAGATCSTLRFDVLLYDLTSTYFEIDAAAQLPEGDKRRHGYSRDHRPDCPQVVIALVVTPEGLPLAYEVLPGNTADNQTLRQFLKARSRRSTARPGASG